jgi:hypothetical protein
MPHNLLCLRPADTGVSFLRLKKKKNGFDLVVIEKNYINFFNGLNLI